MTLERAVFAVAGCVLLVSLALAHFVSYGWLLLTLIIGAGLIRARVTGFCLAAGALRALGARFR